MSSIEHILLAVSILLLLSVLASKASAKLGVPALLLFQVPGMLAGSDCPGGIHFDNASWAQSLGVVALALILFSAGLDTEWASVRRVSEAAQLAASLATASDNVRSQGS